MNANACVDDVSALLRLIGESWRSADVPTDMQRSTCKRGCIAERMYGLKLYILVLANDIHCKLMSAARQSTARVPSLERVQKHHVKIRCWESFASRRERNSVLAHCLLSHTPSESTYKEREATPRRAERHGRAEVWLKAWLVPNAAARPSHTKHTTATTFKKETDGHKTHITHTHTHAGREGERELTLQEPSSRPMEFRARTVTDCYRRLRTVTDCYGRWSHSLGASSWICGAISRIISRGGTSGNVLLLT